MSDLAPEILFLPGFDGAAQLREPFVAALRTHNRARAIGYPNRTLGSLNGYCRFAAAQASHHAPHILVAESFGGNRRTVGHLEDERPRVVGLVDHVGQLQLEHVRAEWFVGHAGSPLPV